MELRDYKTEIIWLLFCTVFLGLLYLIFRTPSPKAPRRQASINYEMPRPEARISPDFSLEGREVDYEYENPFADSKSKKAGHSVKADKGIVKNVKTNAKKLAQKKKESKKRASENQNENKAVSETEPQAGDPLIQNSSPHRSSKISQGTRPAQSNPGNLDLDDDRSEQQWRSLLNAQPTQENMEKLISAYRRGQVSENTFLIIAEDLLKNQKSESQKVGLLGLRSVQTPRAFVLLSDQYESLNADVKPLARQVLLSYGQSSKLESLAQVLRSGNPKATLNALNVIQTLLNTARPDPRDVRSNGSLRGQRRYASLVPSIQQLQQSGTIEVAQLAGQIYSQLVQIGTQPGTQWGGAGAAGGPQQARASEAGLGSLY
jgi:hypothetical protein